MYANCPTPPLQKYVNSKRLHNTQKFRTKCAYLGELEAEFIKAHESGAQGVLFDFKKPKVEILVTLSL
jgi:hypothetical protein